MYWKKMQFEFDSKSYKGFDFQSLGPKITPLNRTISSLPVPHPDVYSLKADSQRGVSVGPMASEWVMDKGSAAVWNQEGR